MRSPEAGPNRAPQNETLEHQVCTGCEFRKVFQQYRGEPAAFSEEDCQFTLDQASVHGFNPLELKCGLAAKLTLDTALRSVPDA